HGFKSLRKISIEWRELLSMGKPIFVSNAMFVILSWASIIAIGLFKDEEMTGLFNVALRLANLTTLSLFVANAFAAPLISDRYKKGDMEGMRKATKDGSKLIFWFGLPLLLILCIFPGFLLSIFGKEFASAIPVLIILSISQFLFISVGPVLQVLNMAHEEKAARNIVSFSALFNVIFNVVFIPLFGIVGAAIADLTSKLIWSSVSSAYVKKRFGFYSFYIPFLSK
ncbi:MAG: polysaccharide biosynthesis C-terminal domain-containing protein, partial [Flavobacteriales bacterium]